MYMQSHCAADRLKSPRQSLSPPSCNYLAVSSILNHSEHLPPIRDPSMRSNSFSSSDGSPLTSTPVRLPSIRQALDSHTELWSMTPSQLRDACNGSVYSPADSPVYTAAPPPSPTSSCHSHSACGSSSDTLSASGSPTSDNLELSDDSFHPYRHKTSSTTGPFVPSNRQRAFRPTYSEEQLDFIWFQREDLRLPWREIRRRFCQQFPSDARLIGGLQCRHYRILSDHAIPKPRDRPHAKMDDLELQDAPLNHFEPSRYGMWLNKGASYAWMTPYRSMLERTSSQPITLSTSV